MLLDNQVTYYLFLISMSTIMFGSAVTLLLIVNEKRSRLISMFVVVGSVYLFMQSNLQFWQVV